MRFPLNSKRPRKQEIDDSESIQSPIGGLNTRDSEAAMKPIYAQDIVNFWPTVRAITMRKGALNWSTGYAKPVRTVMAYRSATKDELWAATDDGLFNATAEGAVGAVASTLTNGYCRYTMFTNSGGAFLIVVNGVDEMRNYNGTAWTNVPAFTGANAFPTTEVLSVTPSKSALFFVRKDSLDFYHLAVEAISGDVLRFPLGSKFSKGGKLVSIGTWTVDGGDGVDDYCCFLTSAGQAAVYRGSDPTNADDWALVGVFDIGVPVGLRPMLKLQGDLLILTDGGLVSLAKCLQQTRIVLEALVSDLIQPTFQEATRRFSTREGWQLCANPNIAMLIVNNPTLQANEYQQYAMNLTTGAWTVFTGWNATCWELLDKTLYFGVGTRVAKAWTEAGGDFLQPTTATIKQAWVYLPKRARFKQIRLIRPNIRLGGNVAVNAMVDIDFQQSDTFGPAVFQTLGQSRFNAPDAVYDQAKWSTLPSMALSWLSVANGAGYCSAIRLRAIGTDVTFEWSATDYAYEVGAIQG